MDRLDLVLLKSEAEKLGLTYSDSHLPEYVGLYLPSSKDGYDAPAIVILPEDDSGVELRIFGKTVQHCPIDRASVIFSTVPELVAAIETDPRVRDYIKCFKEKMELQAKYDALKAEVEVIPGYGVIFSECGKHFKVVQMNI